MRHKQKKKTFMILVSIGALLVLLFMHFHRHEGRSPARQTNAQSTESNIEKTLNPRPLVNANAPDTLRQAGARGRSRGANPDSIQETAPREDTTVRANAETLSTIDSFQRAPTPCKGDTIAPWVYTDPAGGLHHGKIAIKLFGTKPCTIEWKTDSAAAWNTYNGEAIPIVTSTAILLRAVDSCGNRMEQREERYELRPEDSLTYCPQDMEHILVGSTSFCIDRYEWPNKKGMTPRAYVSLYQAMDTCVSYGKRLCTTDEWTIACTGPYGWKYPYGQTYELYACVSNDTTVRPSGSRPECRDYFGVFDMSGNLAEWTSTKSMRNPHYYNVVGGFWESGPQSGCFDVRYSYFPQNRHNPVGFRCCADARPRSRNAEPANH